MSQSGAFSGDGPDDFSRAETISRALAAAARRARLSPRSARWFEGGTVLNRRVKRITRFVSWSLFLAIFATPSLLGVCYLAFLASDQYIAEAKLTLRPGLPVAYDRLSAFTGLVGVTIAQDTQVVADYVKSRAAVDQLAKAVDLRHIYGNREIDWLSRLPERASIEELTRYWDRHSRVSIETPSGIIDIRVTAYRPDDAAAIGAAVVRLSEDLVNAINKRIANDSIVTAETALKRSAKRLADIRADLEITRNQEGFLDAQAQAQSLTTLLTQARASQLSLKTEYSAQANFVTSDAPQMKDLKSRIDAVAGQIDALQARIAGGNSVEGERTLSASLSRFDQLKLEEEIAANEYARASVALELAHLSAEQRTVYLTVFDQPTPPQDARRWWRLTWSLGTVGGALLAWGGVCGLINLANRAG
jgi:capsular polysaccharide transport system permease protein